MEISTLPSFASQSCRRLLQRELNIILLIKTSPDCGPVRTMRKYDSIQAAAAAASDGKVLHTQTQTYTHTHTHRLFLSITDTAGFFLFNFFLYCCMCYANNGTRGKNFAPKLVPLNCAAHRILFFIPFLFWSACLNTLMKLSLAFFEVFPPTGYNFYKVDFPHQ